MKRSKKFKVVVSHPIQYHAVLWRNLAKIENVDFEVLFCSKHGQKVSLDKDFGVAFKWDIPLKDGFKSSTFQNWGFGNGFFKYINLGLILKILFSKTDFIYFHGVNNFTAFFVFWISKIKGSRIMIRNIAHLLEEVKQDKIRFFLKDLVYGSIFRNANSCLYIGKHNKAFYQKFKVDENRLMHAPHVVDNDFFQNRILTKQKKIDFKRRLNIDKDSVVILFCGKLIPIKQPFSLLSAFADCNFSKKVTLLIVGDGILKDELEVVSDEIVRSDSQKEIKFMGFKNQSELPAYYSISDLLILPSIRETWGLVVNEALNFSTAMIVSNHVGCAPELVHDKTGFVFDRNSKVELQSAIEELVENDGLREKFKSEAFRVINNWSIKEYSESIEKIINS